MKIYTKTGDNGKTGLLGGKRVLKSDPRVEALGSLDELNASLGVVRSFGVSKKEDKILEEIQKNLFEMSFVIGMTGKHPKYREFSASEVLKLEKYIDSYDAKLPELRNFILPTGTRAASLLHMARAVCRRAERRVAALKPKGAILPYLNRLGDLLFVLARFENFRKKYKEKIWKGL